MLLWEKAAFRVLSILPGCFSTFSETIEAIKNLFPVIKKKMLGTQGLFPTCSLSGSKYLNAQFSLFLIFSTSIKTTLHIFVGK